MIEASRLRKVFGSPSDGVVAVDDVSFSVARGELFVIMGLSGSGKSTLLRMLNRLVEPTSGELHVDGRDLLAMGGADLRELRNRKVNMVFQHFALFPHRIVRGWLAKFTLTSDQLGSLELLIQEKGTGHEQEAAKEWIAQNRQLVDSWLS